MSLCLRGLSGEPDVYECTYVASTVTELPFFSTKVRLGPAGAEEVLPMVGPWSLKVCETCVESAWFQRLKL